MSTAFNNVIHVDDLEHAMADGRLPAPAAALVDHYLSTLSQYVRLLSGGDPNAPRISDAEKKRVLGVAVAFDDGDIVVVPRPEITAQEETDEHVTVEVDLGANNYAMGTALAEAASVLMDRVPEVMQ